MWRAWIWCVRIAMAFSIACALLWALTHVWGHFDKSFKYPEFLETGRRGGMRNGYVYLNVSPAPTPAEQNLVRQMDELEGTIGRNGVTGSVFRGTTSTGSGDKWLVFGWHQKWTTRQVGPYSGIVNRRTALWIDPLGGTVLGAAPYAVTWAVLAWQRLVVRRRLSKGLCTKCGYDLRASTQRCPECGTPISVQRTSSTQLQRG